MLLPCPFEYSHHTPYSSFFYQGFITRQWVDGVWQAALMAIDRVMEQQLVMVSSCLSDNSLGFFSQARCTTASMISEIKDVIVQLKNTLMDYDYSVGRLVDILLHGKEC